MFGSRIMFRAAASEHCACWFVSSASVVVMASPDMSWMLLISWAVGGVGGSCGGVGEGVCGVVWRGAGRVCCVVGVEECGLV